MQFAGCCCDGKAAGEVYSIDEMASRNAIMQQVGALLDEQSMENLDMVPLTPRQVNAEPTTPRGEAENTDPLEPKLSEDVPLLTDRSRAPEDTPEQTPEVDHMELTVLAALSEARQEHAEQSNDTFDDKKGQDTIANEGSTGARLVSIGEDAEQAEDKVGDLPNKDLGPRFRPSRDSERSCDSGAPAMGMGRMMSSMGQVKSFAKVMSILPGFGGRRNSGMGLQMTAQPSWKGRAVKNMSFQNPTLFRGARIADAMHGFAWLMGPQTPTTEYYEYSDVVEYVGTFLSHNWSSPRNRKFLVFILHFNLWPAFAVSITASATVCALVAFEVLPVVQVGSLRGICLWCRLVGTAMFVVTLVFWHEVTPWFGYKGGTCFFDKVCVHQTDNDLKQKGIESLAAFLYYSWSMLVCYSEIYLTKLWTMYEIASFIMLQPGGCLDVRPMFMPWVVLIALAVVFAYSCAREIVAGALPVDQQGILWIIAAVILVPALVPLYLVSWWWAKEQGKIKDRVDKFRIADANCFSEGDRGVVQKNILAFMKHFEFCRSDANEQEVYEAFEGLLRENVPDLLTASLGRVGMPYRYAMTIFVPFLGAAFDNLARHCIQGKNTPTRTIIADLIQDGTETIALGPLVLAALMISAKVSRRYRREGACALSFLSTTAITALSFGVWYGFSRIKDEAIKTDVVGTIIMVVYILVCIGIVGLCYYFYKPLPRKMYRRSIYDT